MTPATVMTRAQKRALVAQLIAENPDASDREIGRLAGVDGKTVAVVRKVSAEIPQGAETPHCGNSALKLRTAEIQTPYLRKIDAAEIPHSAEFEAWFMQLPGEEIGRLMVALPQEKRSEAQAYMRRAKQRKLGSDANGRAVRLDLQPWKFRTTKEQREAVIAAARAHEGTTAIAKRLGINRGTVGSIIKRGS